MPSLTNDNFGPLVAYLVPGATVLAGLTPYSATLRNWFAVAATDAPSLGGFLYLTVASLAAGMTVSAVRWAVVDTAHGLLGVRPPKLDFAQLGSNVGAFSLLIEIHYRHYQFYANMLVAIATAYVAYRLGLGGGVPPGVIDLGVLTLEIVFFTTSRDNLRKYYARTGQLLKRSRLNASVPARVRASRRNRRDARR